jgi:hypothetical protein
MELQEAAAAVAEVDKHRVRVKHFEEKDYWKQRVRFGISVLCYVTDNYFNEAYFTAHQGYDEKLKFKLEKLLEQQPDFEVLNSIALVPPNLSEALASCHLESVRMSYQLGFTITRPDLQTYFISFENGFYRYISARGLHTSDYPEALKEAVVCRLSGQHRPTDIEKMNWRPESLRGSLNLFASGSSQPTDIEIMDWN